MFITFLACFYSIDAYGDTIFESILSHPVRYLQRIQQLKNEEQIPELVIGFFNNNTHQKICFIAQRKLSYFYFDIDPYFSAQWYPGFTDFCDRMLRQSRVKKFSELKLARLLKLQGMCDRLILCVASLDNEGLFLQESRVICIVDLFANLDQVSSCFLEQDIAYMYIQYSVFFPDGTCRKRFVNLTGYQGHTLPLNIDITQDDVDEGMHGLDIIISVDDF